jgi:hypothetical protein
MSHSVLTQLPLPEKGPAFLLSRHSKTLRRRVEQLQMRHPDWTPEAVRRALFKQGLTVLLADLREIMQDDLRQDDMLPMRVVKARLDQLCR